MAIKVKKDISSSPQPKRRLFFKKKEKDLSKREQVFTSAPIIDLIGYKGFTQNSDHFLILKDSDDGYAEFLTIRGQGLGALSFNQQKAVIEGYHQFLSIYLEDFQIMISPFPTNTSVQRVNVLHRYNKVTSLIANESKPRRKHQLLMQQRYIKDQLSTLKRVEKELFNQDFILILFAKNQRELRINRDNAINWGGNSVILEKMDLEKKKLVLYRMNNLNTRI